MKKGKNIFLVIWSTFTFIHSSLNIHEDEDGFRRSISNERNSSLNYNGYVKATSSFKFVPPEVDFKFLLLNINRQSIGAHISTQFRNHQALMGGILLHFSVEDNDLNLTENLIDIKSELNIEDQTGKTSLYKALKQNNTDMIEMLTDAGADINFINTEGNSLLLVSIIEEDFDVLEKLVNLGATVDVLNKENLTALYKAVELGTQRGIDILLNKSANVNFRNNQGMSLLATAVHKGRLDVVKQLIQLGAEIDLHDNNYITPLYVALLQNNPGIIKVLLDNGANPSFANPKGDTLLHMVVLEGRNDTIQKLIMVGANTNALNTDLLTPLCSAIKINNTEAIRVMIESRVDLNMKCHGMRKIFPLHFAITNGTLEAIKLLLDGRAITTVINDEGMTPLVLAVFQNKPALTRLLNKVSYSVNYIMDGIGNTPLHMAVLKEDSLSVEKFIELGAHVDEVNEDGMTPLCLAAQTNKKCIISILKKNGANLNFQTAFGDTPLHLAVKNRRVAGVIQLIELGAEIDPISSKGFTPLCIAILMNMTDIANALLVKGANINYVCNGNSPYLLAVSNSTLSILKRLSNLGATSNESYASLSQRAVEADNPEIMNYIINKSNNFSEECYKELLFLAASSGSSKVLIELIKKGICVNTTTKDGFTPIWNATINSQIKTIEVLIENGGDLNETVQYNKDGIQLSNWTLLHEAAINGAEEVLKLFLKFGMSTEVKDSRKWTPLHYAAAQHNVAVVKTLIENGASIKAKTNRGELPIDLVRHRRTFKPEIMEWLTNGKV